MATKTKHQYTAVNVDKDTSVDAVHMAIRALSLTLAVLSFPAVALPQNSDVSGAVRDTAGNVLPGVSVYATHDFAGGGSDQPHSQTDGQGRFELKSVGRVIFFVSPKHEAATYIRKPGQASVEVTLQPSSGDRWPKPCAAREDSGKRYGTMFLFLVPRGAKAKTHSGDDTWDLVVSFPKSKTNERLLLWSGPTLGSAFVPDETVLKARKFTQQGFDWRGEDQNGSRWRWFSSYQDLIHYEGASDEAARFFDRIIDSVCVRNVDQIRH